MSSSNLQANRERKERACDGCRRRKTKCDGPWMQRNICTNCIQTRKACTYLEASKPRGPPKAYVTRLEDRLEVLESLLQQLCPDTDFSEELGPPVIRGSWKAHLEPTVPSTSRVDTVPASILTSIQSQPKEIPTPNPLVSPRPHTTHLTFPRSKRSRTITEAVPISSDDLITDSSSSSDTEEMLADSSKGKMKINLLADEPDDIPDETAFRISSTSSTGGLVEALRKLRNMHIGETMNPNPAYPRRPLFWQTAPWEQRDSTELLPKLLLYFPPTDLAETLLNLYFAKSNSVFPLLHRPTFDRQWRDGLHHRNVWFTCVCVCLFAVASRWCDDQRVLPEGPRREDGELDWRKAGHQYFEIGVEIHRIRKNFFQPPNLFELQTFSLMGMYLRGTNAFPVAWVIVSVGIRRAQDAGAHSKKIYRANPNVDDELWKRAFWHLVVFDRIGGVSLGRAFSIAEEDFDVDLPLEVDDEYWDTDKTFEQPPNILSRIAAFNHFIKLTQIMAFTVRTMYAVNKSKTYCGIIPTGKESLVRQLSSAVKEWLETLPEHLKWRDNINNPELSMQSATLFSTYYLTLLLIHRPLITPSPSPPSLTTMSYSSEFPPPMPSDTNPAIHICTDAARSCARIVEVQLRDGLNNFHIPSVINAAYICAGLLSYRIWDLKVQEEAQQCEYSQDVKPLTVQRIEEHMADARIFVRALELVRFRWEVVDSMLEELNASLPGVQSQSLSIPDSPRSNNTSHLGPISDGHPCPSIHVSCPMEIPPGQSSIAPQLEYNQHLLRFSGTEHWAHLQLSQNIPAYPPNTNEPCLHSHNPDVNHNQPHPVALSSRPRSLSALPSYIPEHPLSYTTNSLRRTSFSNLHARGSHDSHERTGVEYPLSLSTPTGSCFSIGGSTVNDIHFDDEASNHHHQTSSYTSQKLPSNIYDKRGFNSLERKCLPASAMRPDRLNIHQSATAPDPSIHNIYGLPCNGQNFYHPAYSS